MKNLIAMGLLVVALSSGACIQPVRADEADHAARNERRADSQDFKAEHSAYRGHGFRAVAHARIAAHDEHKSNREEHRAIRRGEGY